MLGTARDTVIPELESRKQENSNSVQVMPYGHGYIEKSLKLISAGRMDTFLFTRNSIVHKIKMLGLESHYRQSGCLSREDIYMAFSPEKIRQKDVLKMMEYFDQRMAELKTVID